MSANHIIEVRAICIDTNYLVVLMSTETIIWFFDVDRRRERCGREGMWMNIFWPPLKGNGLDAHDATFGIGRQHLI